MKKWFLNIAFLLGAWSLPAHQTELSSTILVEQEDSKWVLQIRSALTAFDQVIQTNFPPYQSAEAFQSLVVDHLKNNLEIIVNEQIKVSLQNGAVQLGHETSVVFEVVGIPENIESLYVKNSSFKSINRNQSALIVLKKGFKKKQFSLNQQNEYELYLNVVDHQLQPVEPTIVNAGLFTNSHICILLGFLILLFVVTYLKLKKSTVNLKS